MLQPHVSVRRARVGTANLRQQDVRLLADEPVLAIGLALAPPRLWGYLLDITLDGFEDGYRRPHDGRVSTRIHQGLRVAQNALRSRIDALIDRRGADAALLAIAREGELLHVLSVGPLHAYVYHQRALRRLNARDAGSEGVLKSEASWCAESVQPGDLLFAAPSALCTDPALERVRSALGSDRQLSPRAVGELLDDGTSEGAQGSAVVAFRIDGA